MLSMQRYFLILRRTLPEGLPLITLSMVFAVLRLLLKKAWNHDATHHVFLRDMSSESAMETLEHSLPYKEWIIGVGLDSNERTNPPIKFKDEFERARRENYFLTMHCDVDQHDSTVHIWQTLNEIGVDRIDQGVNSLEDDVLCRKSRTATLL